MHFNTDFWCLSPQMCAVLTPHQRSFLCLFFCFLILVLLIFLFVYLFVCLVWIFVCLFVHCFLFFTAIKVHLRKPQLIKMHRTKGHGCIIDWFPTQRELRAFKGLVKLLEDCLLEMKRKPRRPQQYDCLDAAFLFLMILYSNSSLQHL